MMFCDTSNKVVHAIKRFRLTKNLDINSVLFTCNRFRERLHSFYP
jgi:hypothetical protein